MRSSCVLFTKVGRTVTAVAVTAFTLATVLPAHAGPKMAGPEIRLMQPKALNAGDNQFEVMVKKADGKPLTGADVSVLLRMPKTSTMGEMRDEVTLVPSGAGMYAGSGSVTMAGKWTVNISVKQGGKELARQQVTLAAK